MSEVIKYKCENAFCNKNEMNEPKITVKGYTKNDFHFCSRKCIEEFFCGVKDGDEDE